MLSHPDGAEGVSQRLYGEAWGVVHRVSNIVYESSVQQALDTARRLGAAEGTQTLVTGSQHLVGAALLYLNGCALA